MDYARENETSIDSNDLTQMILSSRKFYQLRLTRHINLELCVRNKEHRVR